MSHMKAKQNFILTMLILLTVSFGGLAGISLTAVGTEVLNHTYKEVDFEKEGLPADQVKSFTLTSASLCKLNIKSSTVNQSWVWSQVRILDDKDRAVKDYSFTLSRYSGSEDGYGWTEDDSDDYKMIRLPAGTYKVMVSGEDSELLGGVNIQSLGGQFALFGAETITIRVTKDEWMSRYFLGLFILFTFLTFLCFLLRQARSKKEPVVSVQFVNMQGGFKDV